MEYAPCVFLKTTKMLGKSEIWGVKYTSISILADLFISFENLNLRVVLAKLIS